MPNLVSVSMAAADFSDTVVVEIVDVDCAKAALASRAGSSLLDNIFSDGNTMLGLPWGLVRPRDSLEPLRVIRKSAAAAAAPRQ
ncbi:hypothetical protein BGZ47_010142 [Haplosporangium gracile]|nr:hypothetical protein BGZ47_010142 [Haplosporangium gracile]